MLYWEKRAAQQAIFIDPRTCLSEAERGYERRACIVQGSWDIERGGGGKILQYVHCRVDAENAGLKYVANIKEDHQMGYLLQKNMLRSILFLKRLKP